MNERVGTRRMMCAGRVFLTSLVVCGLIGAIGCGSSGSGGSGTGGGGAGSGTPLVSGGAKDIYVVQLDSSGMAAQSVMDFAADTDGSLTPKTTFLPAAGFGILSIATDSGGQLYVGVASLSSTAPPVYQVLVYASGATSTSTPMRTINLPAVINEGFLPLEMTVDASGKLYVVGLGVVGVFAANANGDASPTSMFTLANGSGPTGIAVDAAGNVYIANFVAANADTPGGGEILIFAAGASGTALPMETISTQGEPYGVTLDANGNIYTSLNTLMLSSSGAITTSTCQVMEFGSLAAGSLATLKTITGTATGVSFGAGPQIDLAGNLYLVSEVTSGTGNDVKYTDQVVGFAPTATGNVAPGVMFSSSSWTLAGSQIAVH